MVSDVPAGDGSRNRLLLIDGHSVAYRAFYALPVENFSTTTGQPTNAVFGFTSMLINVLRDEEPTHLAVTFDVSRSTFRTEAFADYKAGRSETPQDFKGQTLITYPVERERLDIFTRFLEPADVEPAQVRTSELTVMMMQLVASGRGVCGMPHWALHEYSSRGYVKAKRLGEKGLFATLYAAIRADMLDAPYMRDFLLTAKDTSFSTLDGVSAVR